MERMYYSMFVPEKLLRFTRVARTFHLARELWRIQRERMNWSFTVASNSLPVHIQSSLLAVY